MKKMFLIIMSNYFLLDLRAEKKSLKKNRRKKSYRENVCTKEELKMYKKIGGKNYWKKCW